MILVLGLAKSGIAAAKLAHDKGSAVRASDMVCHEKYADSIDFSPVLM